MLSRVYSGTTQLNSTRRRVELRRGSVHSGADATRRRVVEAYTVRQRSKIISERRDPDESICRARRNYVNYDVVTRFRFFISRVCEFILHCSHI